MKIENSALSMDAYTDRREVGASTQKNALPTLTTGQQLGPFSLTLEDDAMIEGRTVTPLNLSQGNPIPTNNDSLGNPAGDDASKNVLQRAVGGLLQTELSISRFERNSRPLQNMLGAGDQVWGRMPFNMLLQPTQIYHKTETFNFASSGSIETEDGRKIDFSLDLSLTRHETSYWSSARSLPVFLDPLVLSFDDGLSTLSGASFSFDLTGDGLLNDIGVLSEGSGFLSLDLNDDGIINDGHELFGPLTGHGFNELANYDLDNNSWIDENDPIFEELKVWMGAGGDNESLISLREAGVGAISLSNLATHFDLKDSDGRALGTVARAGIFFLENGEPRSLQELDLNLNAGDDNGQFTDDSLKETLEQAIVALEQILRRRRSQLEFMTQRWGILEEKKEDLAAKFWQWHEKNLLG